MAFVRELAARRRHGERDRLGSANYVDAAARRRGASAVVDGTAHSLSRPLVPHSSPSGRAGMVLTTYFETMGSTMAGTDHVELDCHGFMSTHLDSLNHIGLDGAWYAGWPTAATKELSVSGFARHGLVTRGVVIDVPAVRGCDHVSADAPVTGADIEAGLELAGATFESGDALLLYMGRDRFEAAGGDFAVLHGSGEPTPGVGMDGARWIAEHPVSVVAWDFQDALAPSQARFSVHFLIWAIGLLLVDNCDYSAVIPRLRERNRLTGLFSVAPLLLDGATGGNVNPLLVV
ncbi:MAG: cyclase family protein [Ilumatobacteraceae bacterium]